MSTPCRPVFPHDRVHPLARARLEKEPDREIVREVEAAIAEHDVVVVGMSQNPHPRRACKLLRERGIPHHYLEYGSYLGPWRKRNELKMWTGWRTFPMIFVKGTFIGGASELAKLDESGDLAKMLGR